MLKNHKPLQLSLLCEVADATHFFYGEKYGIGDFCKLLTLKPSKKTLSKKQLAIGNLIYKIDKASPSQLPIIAFAKLFNYARNSAIFSALRVIEDSLFDGESILDFEDYKQQFEKEKNTYIAQLGSYLDGSGERHLCYNGCFNDMYNFLMAHSHHLPKSRNLPDKTLLDFWEILDIDLLYGDGKEEGDYTEKEWQVILKEHKRISDISCHSRYSNFWIIIHFLVAVYFEKNMDLERDFAKQLSAYRQSKYYTPCY